MPSYPKVRALTEHERTILDHRTKSENTEHSKIARIILISAEGRSLEEIGDSVGVHSETVRRWIMKFNRKGLEGITPAKRGPKLRFTAEQREKIVHIAHARPGELGQSFSEWTSVKLAKYLSEQGIVESISHVSVRQILRESEVENTAGSSHTAISGASDSHGKSDRIVSPGESGIAGTEHLSRPPLSTFETFVVQTEKLLGQRKFTDAVQQMEQHLRQSVCTPDEEATLRCLLSEALEACDDHPAMRKAVEMYESADCRALLSERQVARVRHRLGWAYSLERDHPRAFARLNEALRSFVELGDAQGASETHYALGRTYMGINEYKIARDHLLEAIHFQRFKNDRSLLAQIYHQLGLVDYYEGDFAGAKTHYLKAFDLCRNGTNHKLLGQLYVNLGLISMYDEFPDRAEATRRFKDAIAHFEQVGERDYISLTYNNLADNLIHSGQWDEAERYLQDALTRVEGGPPTKYPAIALATLGELACYRGRYSEAKKYLDESVRLLPLVGSEWVEGVVYLVLGNFSAVTGAPDLARNHLNVSLQITTSLGNQFGRIMANISLAELLLGNGEVAKASEHLRVAEAGSKESSVLALSGRIKRLRGLLEATENHTAEAVQHLSQSVSAFATAQDVFEEARSRFELGRLLAAGGEPGLAAGEIRLALDVFRNLEAAPYMRSAEDLLKAQPSWSGREALSRPYGQQFHGTKLPGAASAASATQRAFDAGSTVSPESPLLVERLLEAAGSRDLILQELISIAESLFKSRRPLKTIVYRVHEGVGLQPLVVRGTTQGEAEERLNDVRETILSGKNSTATGRIFLVRAGELETLAIYIQSSPVLGPEADQLRPFVKQAEVMLENCALRSLRRTSTAAPVDTVKYSVREAIPGFLYASEAMAEVIERIHKIRRSDVTVLITGESGTGKELVARTIHAESARRTAIFLPFNCTAVSPELVESQLFGHRRGAFTGAVNHYQGIVRAAEGGTFFLDEIGDLSLTVQPKLLRFMQEGEIQPVGQAKPEKVDVRVITATNTDLEKAVAEGRFREDLYHRLNIIRLHVPALRERLEEVPVLAEHYLQYFAKRSGRSGLAFDRDVLDLFFEYDWPGNVRQLRNEIERAVAYAGSDETIKPEDLSPEILRSRRGSFPRFESGRSESLGPAQRSGLPRDHYPPASQSAGGNASDIGWKSPLVRNDFPAGGESRISSVHREAQSQPMPLDQAAPRTPSKLGSGSRWLDDRAETNAPPPITTPSSLKEATEQLERQMIADALRRHRHNVTKTAQELGMSRRGLRLKIDQLRIEI